MGFSKWRKAVAGFFAIKFWLSVIVFIIAVIAAFYTGGASLWIYIALAAAASAIVSYALGTMLTGAAFIHYMHKYGESIKKAVKAGFAAVTEVIGAAAEGVISGIPAWVWIVGAVILIARSPSSSNDRDKRAPTVNESERNNEVSYVSGEQET